MHVSVDVANRAVPDMSCVVCVCELKCPPLLLGETHSTHDHCQ